MKCKHVKFLVSGLPEKAQTAYPTYDCPWCKEMPKEPERVKMSDYCPTKELKVTVQSNGIIRDVDGLIIARLEQETDFEDLKESEKSQCPWCDGNHPCPHEPPEEPEKVKLWEKLREAYARTTSLNFDCYTNVEGFKAEASTAIDEVLKVVDKLPRSGFDGVIKLDVTYSKLVQALEELR